ncbi:hypothetical protein [Lysinibacillus piscis]|uniref:Uncharacterized protein n=1 Tax=Lysinibacillus piscis TaxID=2518931 RepID=A0ABQ5NIR6_9BACI|nr:hypothetical protein [Lysinibacillus sp. KH24]GLC88270.1 hypothetical protein LYSBPC_13970 [Lysinibacillus sp. KH24]
MVLYYWHKYTATPNQPPISRVFKEQETTIYTFTGNTAYTTAIVGNQHQLKLNGGEVSSADRSSAGQVLYTAVNSYEVLEYLSRGRITNNGTPEYWWDVYRIYITNAQVYYNKGSFITTIQAEETTYTNNARNADGYWYERGTVVNTAPTQPGAFTQPSGLLEIGDDRTFSVGAASDAESNLAKYIWEASINSGAYTKVGETTTPNLTYKIPTAINLKMRVKAVDTGGLESAYRESSLYTVIEPQYYWQKYNTKTNYTYGFDWQSTSGHIWWTPNSDASEYFESFTIVENNGHHTPRGTGRRAFVNYTPANGHHVYRNYETYGVIKVLVGDWGSTEFTAGKISLTHVQTLEWMNVTVTAIDYSRSSFITTLQGTYSQYPNDQRNPNDGYWYIRGNRVNQSIAPPTAFTQPTQNKKFRPSEVATIAFGASNAPNLALYEVDYKYGTGAWTQLAYNTALTRSLTITTDKSLKTLELRVRAKNTSNIYSDYIHSEVFVIEHNLAPVVTLTNPSANTTLYENDILQIAGSASDVDANQSVTVYAQINSEQRIALGVGLSNAPISFSKQLKFSGGKLYDGDTVLTTSLLDGVPQIVKVWAQDGDGAQSTIVERTFYVVPNRAPQLTVDAVVPSGVIDADKFTISGTATDLDANSDVTVTRRINGGNPIEIYNGTGGEWEFDISLAQLKVGENSIVIEVIDNYSAKASKTIKLNKNEIKTPILHSVARYKIEPPKGSAKGVLLWIQRDVDLELVAELSMTLQGEQEQYATLTADHTAPVSAEIVEDEFYYEATEPKNNIILKLSATRPDSNVNHKIHLISGVLE